MLFPPLSPSLLSPSPSPFPFSPFSFLPLLFPSPSRIRSSTPFSPPFLLSLAFLTFPLFLLSIPSSFPFDPLPSPPFHCPSHVPSQRSGRQLPKCSFHETSGHTLSHVPSSSQNATRFQNVNAKSLNKPLLNFARLCAHAQEPPSNIWGRLVPPVAAPRHPVSVSSPLCGPRGVPP